MPYFVVFKNFPMQEVRLLHLKGVRFDLFSIFCREMAGGANLLHIVLRLRRSKTTAKVYHQVRSLNLSLKHSTLYYKLQSHSSIWFSLGSYVITVNCLFKTVHAGGYRMFPNINSVNHEL